FTAKMTGIWQDVYRRGDEDGSDVDEDLYGGFIGNADRRQLNRLRSLSPEALAMARTGFEDRRLDELLFRYRARNFPQTLTSDEALRWREHCAARLVSGADGARTAAALLDDIARLSAGADARAQAVLGALREYVAAVLPV
ncbi:MAG: exodeoxyribonuclease I, partial [Burkholderiaceae bacterium]|nr:exodeoxyribonuclease I [Burkholderiaceae bacterium]